MSYKVEFEDEELKEIIDSIESSLHEYSEQNSHYNDSESKKNIEICKNILSKLEKGDSMQQIKIKYLKDIMPLEVNDKGDWIDLRAAEDVDMTAGDYYLIPLGVSMKLPEGYEAHVVPRSSTFKKWGIIQSNHMGVIDNSYSGSMDEWKFPAIALRTTHIHKNDRICQFRLVKNQEPVEFIKVDHLDDTNRGGFGSTGTD